jgi:hypothetical protein
VCLRVHVPVAQLAEAIPAPGSGLKLPLDLHHIASHCSNAFYAPRRFAAVQLAFDCPRCRVLVFRDVPCDFESGENPYSSHIHIMSATVVCVRRHWTTGRNRCSALE